MELRAEEFTMKYSCMRGVVALWLILTASVVFAQYSGTIRGVVTDPSGAVIAGADVSVINQASGVTRSSKSNDSGEYVFPELAPGTYQVHVKQGNFKEFVARDVELHVSSSAVVDVKLEMGRTTEQVTVEANAVQVQSDSAQLGEVISGQQARELPLNGRVMTQLMLLEPGTSPKDNLEVTKKGLQTGSDISINGNPVTNNLWLVDGANDNDIGSNRTLLIYPSLDAIAEFKMLRNAYGPEYGQASGGIVSIITKSGTNQWHGSAFYSGRNDALNADTFFAARHASEAAQTGQHLVNDGKDVLRHHDWGYSLGGPVKKDKLFFFWSQEWNRDKRGQTRQSCVPTAAERAGDFTAAWNAWTQAGSNPDSVVDQCNAALPALPGTRSGNNKVGTPLFTVPGGALDPAGVLIEDALPLPTFSNIAPNSGNNWFQSLGTAVTWRQENARVDFNLNPKNTLTFRYTQDSWNNPAPNAQQYWGDDPFPAVEGGWKQPSKSTILKDTQVLSSTLTNEVQLSYSNNRIYATLGGTGVTQADALGNTYTPAALVQALEQAIPPSFPADTKKPLGMPPDAAWGGFGSYGGGNALWLIAPWNNSNDLYNFRDDLAKVHGNHTMKAGILIGYSKKHEPSEGGHDRPNFTFNNGNIGEDGTKGKGPGTAYNPVMDLLTVGSQYSFSENSLNLFPTAVWHDYEFYVQDNWKVRRNLTVEYGFRWSFLQQPIEQHNRITSWSLAAYNPALPVSDACNGIIIVPGTHPCQDANALNGTNFSAGTPGTNHALVANGNHNIAPRLGISWDPRGDGKTAIRAGVGQFYQRERVSRVTALMGQNAPFSVSFSSNRTLDSAPSAAGAGASPNFATDPGAVIPNSWQWNVSVERELARNTSLQIGYVGNRGLHLTSDRDANGVLPQNRLDAVFLPPPCDNNTQPLRPACNFGGIDEFGHAGSSSYHSLQFLFRSQLGNRSQIQAAYTWSHSISNILLSDSSGSGFGTHSQTDPYNINADRGNSPINRPHIFVANAVFFLPKFAGANTFVKHGLGDWEFSTIFQALSGVSATQQYNASVTDINAGNKTINDNLGTGNGGNNINTQRFMITGVKCNAGERMDQIYNAAAFTLVGYKFGTIGNEPVGYCHGPRQINLDTSLYKNWKLTEKLSLQFRFDGFNILNHPQFNNNGINGGLVTAVACGNLPCSQTNNIVTEQSGTASSSFGQATQIRPSSEREFQYGLKFIF
jgi:hypothetical protein